MSQYLIYKNLLLRCHGQGVDIRHDDGHDEVGHDEGAEDDEADEEDHGEHQGEHVLIVGLLVEVVELELPEDHHDDLEQAFPGVVELVPLARSQYFTMIMDRKKEFRTEIFCSKELF